MIAQELAAHPAGRLGDLTTVEYLGSKRRLLSQIVSAIHERVGLADHVIDAFTGTGAVAAGLKVAGFRVEANDHLAFCTHFARALLSLQDAPTFQGIGGRTYSDVLAHLNNLPREKGFIYWSYSPASLDQTGVERRYFSRKNAAKIDAIRGQIQTWQPRLTAAEYSLLITDLLRAASSVSNVAGTYGCYLKNWKPRALEGIELQASSFIAGRSSGHQIHRDDAINLLKRVSAPVVYADPPYTKRQYAAYYHILETIALGDAPTIEGSTGLRDWRSHASDFCYKRRAPHALRELVEAADCEHFFLSYSEDGQIPHHTIIDILRAFGPVDVTEWPLSRYRSNAQPHRGAILTERLYYLRKAF